MPSRSSTARPAGPVRPKLPVDSLAHALLGAARVCVGVRAGHPMRAGLDAERRLPASRPPSTTNSWSDPQAAIHDLAARTLRRRGRADALLALLAQRVPDPPLLRELMVVSIALVVDALSADFSPEATFDERVAGLAYSPFTLVDQAVHAATSDPELARAKGFVNAILRTLLRRIADDPAALRHAFDGPQASHEARHELPGWWVARLTDAYPSTWPDIVAASLDVPPLVVRVNRRKTTRDDYLRELLAGGVEARAVGDAGVRFERPVPVSRIPGFAAGVVSVQDEGAQRAATLLDVRDGMRVLDACAAPGGKTGHLLELADLDLTALDADASRLVRVRENLDRLGVAARLVTGDAATPATWWDGRRFDRILADVPCTASGILRRHPDIRWLRRESDVGHLSRKAQQITDALWSLLDPGGKFLLVTCSVFPEESVRHAEIFGARNADARRLPAPGQLLPTATDPAGSHASSSTQSDHDGLFFALFEKIV